jgi:hypothetical protein
MENVFAIIAPGKEASERLLDILRRGWRDNREIAFEHLPFVADSLVS